MSNRSQNEIENSLASPAVQIGGLNVSSESSQNLEQEIDEKSEHEVNGHEWSECTAILNRICAIVHLLTILLLYIFIVNPIVYYT